MEQPKGYEIHVKMPLVCKIKKSLYGLTQSPQKWYKKFNAFMRSQSYDRSNEDSCLYTKKCLDDSYVISILYVDDMLIANKNKDELSKLKTYLSQTFDMKNLGNAKHILNMCITHDRINGCIYLPQFEYVCKILKKFNMKNAKPLSIPLSMHVKLGKNEIPKSYDEKEYMSKIPYQLVVGNLMYAMIATRPNIALQWEL